MQNLHGAKIRKSLLYLVLLVAAAFFSGELALRGLGLMDFPLYDATSTIGYIPSIRQHGKFLNKYDWLINERHMSAGPFTGHGVLLVGDSIVYGGNSFRQSEKLGPQLAEVLKEPVWPIAAGSWALQNELTYLLENPDVARSVDRIVIVSNDGDFDVPSSWSCQATHPRSKPALAWIELAYKLLPTELFCDGRVSDALKVMPKPLPGLLQEVLSKYPSKIAFIKYPTVAETVAHSYDSNWIPFDALSRKLPFAPCEVLAAREWGAQYYKDEIHPSPQGDIVLAKIIGAWIKSHPVD